MRKSAALAYAENGASVALLGLDEEKLEKVKTEIMEKGRDALAIRCDVTKEQEVQDTIKNVLKKYGHIDILLNNAGVAVPGGVETLKEEEWDKSFNVNVKGMYLLSKYVIPEMKKQNYGKNHQTFDIRRTRPVDTFSCSFRHCLLFLHG